MASASTRQAKTWACPWRSTQPTNQPRLQRPPSVRRLPLAHSLFAEGALVFPKFKSRKVSLKSDLSPRSVAVSYMNLPHMGFWQAKEAPFVCIEPWHGLADEDGYTGEFKDRAGVVSLPVGQSFHSRLIIETN